MEHSQEVVIQNGMETFSVPMVFDSPHSGTWCPPDMQAAASENEIMSSCDALVDELWAGVATAGGVLVAARFHRVYVDVNRDRRDIDQELLAEPWRGAVSPTEKTRAGMGLIRRLALPGVPMYARKLSLVEVEHRLDHYYDSYHAVLASVCDRAYARFGRVWHVNCHSMKSIGNAMNADNGQSRPDMVVSDRHGTSADPQFTRWVAGALREFGYHVTVNAPYIGGDIVRKYGNPHSGWNSIQIEINRRLYMDEETLEKTHGFSSLQDNLNTFISYLVMYIRAQLRMPITTTGG